MSGPGPDRTVLEAGWSIESLGDVLPRSAWGVTLHLESRTGDEADLQWLEGADVSSVAGLVQHHAGGTLTSVPGELPCLERDGYTLHLVRMVQRASAYAALAEHVRTHDALPRPDELQSALEAAGEPAAVSELVGQLLADASSVHQRLATDTRLAAGSTLAEVTLEGVQTLLEDAARALA